MKQVIYTSATTRSFHAPAFAAVLRRIRVRNLSYGLTGILYVHSGSLLHVLEGPEPYLSTTFGRILRDPRHSSINILSVKEVDQREFGQEPMALHDTTEDTVQTGPLADVRLRPLLTLNEATARRFLHALKHRPACNTAAPQRTLNFILHDNQRAAPNLLQRQVPADARQLLD